MKNGREKATTTPRDGKSLAGIQKEPVPKGSQGISLNDRDDERGYEKGVCQECGPVLLQK
jgi:hypothetical protein